ncbi:hypothetical protein IH992_19430, partial [Candidatus Poribacteria bacterium]|nr:hypothetical protein [Candidatus Poribacteria bacterium]
AMIRRYTTAICASLLLALTISHALLAQQLPFETYSVKAGLAGSNVNAILQDRQGYLWFGTMNGLSRFDGIEFDSFGTDDGMAGDRIKAIMQDRLGRLWFGGDGLTLYDSRSFKIMGADIGLNLCFINSMLEDRNGNIWIGTYEQGVFV